MENEILLFAAVIKRAIRDAQQTKKPKLRYEALEFVWQTAPTVAQKAKLPPVATVADETARHDRT